MVPDGATVVARFLDDAPAVISRQVGAGRVIAFATTILDPQTLTDDDDAVEFARALQASYGGRLDHPAWGYRVPGDPDPSRPPWADDAG